MIDPDTIEIAEVPEEERLNKDGGEGSDALGEVEDDLEDVYAEPGDVVEEPLT